MCPDHQYRKVVCKHILSVIQQNSDLARVKTGANISDADPAPHHDNTLIKSLHACGSSMHKSADAALNKDDIACVDNKDLPDKAAKSAGATDTAKDNATYKDAHATARESIKEVVERLTAGFPELDIPDITDMPSKEAMISIADAIDQLEPQDALIVKEHAQPLMLALMDDLASDEPEMIININSIDKDPSACPHCGSACIKYGSRYNNKGKTQTYLCKGPKQHRFTFAHLSNVGGEISRYFNSLDLLYTVF